MNKCCITIEHTEIEAGSCSKSLNAVIIFMSFVVVGGIPECITGPQAEQTVETIFGTNPEIMGGTKLIFDVLVGGLFHRTVIIVFNLADIGILVIDIFVIDTDDSLLVEYRGHA